ncbi:PREDICTED: uncharacterized protein LOC104807749 [Tarenaya hassleriana]|uniref:uncharacterized protein LOC104807749 n=1 Tax=Tarenaya hassleriana TaxID=28532 RepID=UPI00053C9EB8|nr:PREDICTED: uncharacterized protein LOC104807749 [Tarenaya hassleriana]
MTNLNAGFVHPGGKTVFIDTSLGTHLVTLLDDSDTVSHFKKKLLEAHRLCFPDVGDIEISALKVKRRGHLYHLSDTMFVVKAFEGISKSWFLFLDARKVEKEGENLQLQCIDYGKQVKYLSNVVEPFLLGPSGKLCEQESDHQLVKSKPSVCLSGADKEHATDFDMEAEHGHDNHPDVHYPETHSVMNIEAEHQKKSAAADHNNLDPKFLEKEKDDATGSEFLSGSTRNEVMDVQQNPSLEEASGSELAMTTKRTRISKRETKISEYHVLETDGPSGVSALTSATNAHEKTESIAEKVSANVEGNGNVESEHLDGAAPVAIEHSMVVRENPDFQVNSIDAGADVSQHKHNENAVENAVSVKEASIPETPARKRRKVGKKHGKEDSVVAAKPDVISPQRSMPDGPKASNLDAAEIANDHLEAISGLTASPTADKKKKRKRSSKFSNISAAAAAPSRDLLEGNNGVSGKADLAIVGSDSCAISPREKLDEPLTAAIEKETEMVEKNVEDAIGSRVAVLSADASPTADKKKKRKRSSKFSDVSAAASTIPSRDLLEGNNGVSGKADLAIVGSESCAISPREKLDEPLTATIEKETEMVEKNVEDAVGSRLTILSAAADNLQTADFRSTPLLSVQESRKLDLIGNYSDQIQNIGHEGKNATPMLENANPGTLTAKNDSEATANKGNVELNADEVKDAKSSQRKRKLKKAKTPVEEHVEGSGIGISSAEPVKVVDGGEGTDSVIRNVLQSLQQSKENEENLEKVEKKSRKKTKKKQPLDVVDSQGPLVQENKAVENEAAPMVSTNYLKEMVELSIPGKTSATRQSSRTILGFENDNGIENGDPLLSKKNTEVFDSARDTASHELDGNGKGNLSNQAELGREKENAFTGDNFDITRTDHGIVSSDKKLDRVANGTGAAEPAAKPNNEKKKKTKKKKETSVKHPEGSIDESQSSMKPNNKRSTSKRAQPASSSNSQISSKVKNGSVVSLQNKDRQNLGIGAIDDVSHKREKKDSKALIPDAVNNSVKGTANKKEVVKSFSGQGNKSNPKVRKKNTFRISGGIFDNLNSEEDEPKLSGSSTRTPLDASSDYTEEESDATFMSQKTGNRVFGGEGNGETDMSSGRKDMMSLEKILRSSSRFKKAKLTASQSQPDGDDDDDDDEALPFDCVPDSQAQVN